MKLLWMCNVPTKRIELMKNTQQSTCVGGWLEGLSESLLADKDIEFTAIPSIRVKSWDTAKRIILNTMQYP